MLSSSSEDRLLWRWTASNEYSAKSFYDTIITGEKTKCKFYFTWKLKIPPSPSMRIFCFLCIKGKLLSHEVMLRRGWLCDSRCMMCTTCNLETTFHLLFKCDYAMNVWRWFNSFLGFSIMHRGNSNQQTISRSWKACQRRVGRNAWGGYFFSVCWVVWKERNNKIFEEKFLDARGAAHRAWNEALLWMQYC